MHQGFLKILEEYEQLTEQMSSGGDFDMAKVGKRQVELLPVVEKIQTLQKLENEIESNKELLDSDDEQMKAMAHDEIRSLESQIIQLTEDVEAALIPKDEYYQNNAIVEMRAGAGGDEAGLFAAELFR